MDEALDHAQSETGSLALGLGGEERLEHLGLDLRGHAGSGIGYANLEPVAGKGPWSLLKIVVADRVVADGDAQGVAWRHGVASVDREVEDRRFQAGPVDHARP